MFLRVVVVLVGVFAMSVFAAEKADESSDSTRWHVGGTLNAVQFPNNAEMSGFNNGLNQPNGDWAFGMGLYFGQITKDPSSLSYKWYLGSEGVGEINDTATFEYYEALVNLNGGVDFLIPMSKAADFYIGPSIALNAYATATSLKGSDSAATGPAKGFLSFGGNMGFAFYATDNFSLDLGSKIWFPVVSQSYGPWVPRVKGGIEPDPSYILDVYLGFTGYID